MKYSVLEKKLADKIQEHISEAAPGVSMQVHQAGRKICDIRVGKTYAYYDYASLTKIIFTVQAFILAFEQKKWDFQSKVIDFIPWFRHENIKITDLLTHQSGLLWWKDFYHELNLNEPIIHRWSELATHIRDLPLEKTDKAVYSDVGFLTLAYVLEAMYSKPLALVWQDLQEAFYGRTTLHFNPENKPTYDLKLYAPTTDCPWRKKMIQGEVHDENAWALGGVSTHAGLFGSIDDLGWYALFLRSQLFGIPKTQIRQKTFQLFTQKAMPTSQGDWAMGYMMPTKGSSSSGKYFSSSSIGHTGFTGTSLWYDPATDISIGILTNRVIMGRDNPNFKLLRPELHNWVIEALRRQ